MFVILVKFTVSPEYRKQLIDALNEDRRGSLRDERKTGTIRFDIVYDDEDSNFLFLYEVYRDETAFEVHTKGLHYKRFMKTLESIEKKLGIKILEELGRGIISPPVKGRA